jgi:predicted ferric reductase
VNAPPLVRGRPATTSARKRPARRRPVVVDVLAAAAGLGLGISIALAVTDETGSALGAPGGLLTALGRISGMLAAYAMVVVVLLAARIPPLERAVGQDRLIVWHRKLGPWGLYLVCAHAVLITIGYAEAAKYGLLSEIAALLSTYPGVLAATVGFGLLIMAGVTSYRKARRRLKYETWWAIHLYTYLALYLSFAHQIDTGAPFVGHPLARLWWTWLWVGALVVIVAFRVVLPLWRSARHRLRVVDVHPAGPDTLSVLVEGRHLDRLPVAGGQFFQWRFLRRGLWWQAHPYSLSAAPTDRQLRITVKKLGDHSAGLARITRGTWVAFEGPYGVFTADARQGERVLLVGAGVGSTPIRALLEELPAGADIVVLLRGSRTTDLVLRHEFAEHVAQRGGRLHDLVGPRDEVRLDAVALRTLVPDLPDRDVYVCGPDSFTEAVVAACRRCGVPTQNIHHESFAF